MTIMTGMIPLLVILILEISYKKNKVEGEKLSNLTILYIILIYFYVISIISFTSIEVYNIKDKGSEYTTSIQFNDSCITFNDPSYIIGNTRNYLFYYDGDKKETNIYPMTEIKKISFKEIEYKKEKEIRERNKKGVVLDSLKSKDTLNF